MEKNQDFYEIIRDVISSCQEAPTDRELLKTKIKNALDGADYPSAIIAYLWGAYYNLDGTAKKLFQEGIFAELKEQYPSLYDFFSFYFESNALRRGFDRRSEEDRRKCYLLDYSTGKFVERRSHKERRKNPESRAGWTRLERWISVPFNRDQVFAGEDKEMRSLAAGKTLPSSDAFHKEHVSIDSLDIILRSLTAYFEIYMQSGQTAWKDAASSATLKRAEEVMKKFIAMLSTGQPVKTR